MLGAPDVLLPDGPEAERPVDGGDLPEDPGELAEAMERHAVFGRVPPARKREMVRALQARGHVVAMTGDGVNDVLAVKEADLGIAMGTGAAATRAVAQLVLLDSTFDALPAVVAEGRRVLGNIERTASLYLTKTVYAMLLALGVGAFRRPFPFLPRHLTLIAALTIGIPSFFLALAPNVERAAGSASWSSPSSRRRSRGRGSWSPGRSRRRSCSRSWHRRRGASSRSTRLPSSCGSRPSGSRRSCGPSRACSSPRASGRARCVLSATRDRRRPPGATRSRRPARRGRRSARNRARTASRPSCSGCRRARRAGRAAR
ncbi:MAG: hypothetical protein KatS3mg014_0514 [Actinomycetota bacterium]|nr:MAG: hypothetical protein KatS3mg014_0514 [Actinomycetota bacterium]